jgi:hypothetical protein
MKQAYSWPLRGLPARAAAFITQRLAQAGAGAAGLLLALLLPLVASAQATPPAWQVALSGNNNQPGTGGTSLARASAVDASGNVFITGSFTGSVSFGSTRLVSASIDVFVAKWDATAQAFTWATSGGGTGADAGYGIAVSGTGVYVTGYFASGTSASFAGQPLAGTGTINADVFVAKYVDTSTGSTAATSSFANAWATSGGGTGADIGYGIAVSGAGVFVTGSFASAGSASFAGQPLAGTGTSNLDMFVAKYVDTSTGSTAATSSFANGWATSGGGTGTDIGYGIAVSGTGVFVTGSFASGANASLAGQALAGAGGNDVFVAKYVDTSTGSTAATSSFANAWATSGGGTGNDYGYGIAVSGTGVYVTGSFTTSASFAGQALAGAGTGTTTDVFVAKYVDTSTGSTAATSSFANGWATSGGGTGADIGYGIAVSGAGVYVTGSFASGSSASLAGQALAGTGTNNADVFVAKYVDTSTGTTQSFANGWATSGGGTGNDIGYGIAVSGTGVYAAGQVGTAIGSFGAAPNTRYAPLSSAVLGALSPADGTWQQADGPLQGGTSLARATAVDASGNVFITGSFSGSVSFGSTRLVSAGASNTTDVFVAKWDATAQAFTWATSGGGTGADVGNGIAVSGTGVFVTGSYQSASATRASFAGQALPGTGTSSNTDMFVAKYVDTSTGSTAATSSFANGWATSGGGTDNDQGNGIAVSGTGVYVTGSFASNTGASLAGQALPGTGTSSNTDMFVAKYVDTSTGSTAATSSFANGWATSGGGTAFDYGYGIAVSGTGVFVTGSFASGSSASLAGQALAGTGTNNADVFVAKYVDTSTGTTQSFANGWATSGGGTAFDVGNGIAVSGTGVYVTGSFASNTGASLAGQALAGAGSTDVFVAKYVDTSTGSTAATSSFANGWVTSGGGTAFDYGYGIAVSGTGVYVTGYFGSASNASIAGQALAGAGTNGLSDVFVAKYVDTSTSTTQSFANGWATSGGGTGNDRGLGIAVSGQRVYAAGSVTPLATFGSLTVGNTVSGQINFLSGLTDTTPILVSLTPASGVAGSTLAATGTLLAGATAITFTSSGGTATAAPTGYVVASGGTGITGIGVPPGLAPGQYTVTVTTPGGTSNGLTFVVSPPTNNALAFDGVDDYVQTAPTPAPQLGTGNLTLEAWVRTTSTAFNLIMGANGSQDYWLGMTNNKAVFVVNGGLGNCASTTSINDGRWHHVAGVRAGAQTFIYVDGQLENTFTIGAGTLANPTGYLSIGRYGSTTTGYYWQGGIDEARFYSAALTAAQVQADMFSTTAAVPGSLKAYYNMDQGTAGGTNAGITSLTDQSGNGSTGTLNNFDLTGTSSNWVRSFPTITGIAPTSGPTGTSVTVTGTNLTDATGFAFNGTATTGFTTPTSDLTATVTVPGGATTGPVSVSAATLTKYNGPAFTVVPALTSLSPTSGGVGTSITLTGTSLTGATAVSFNGTAATTFTVVAATTITVTVPAGASSGNVTVTTAGGTSNGLAFTVVAPPTLTAVAPNPGGLGQAITLTGTGLGSPTALTINGANALAGLVSNSGTSLVVRVPLGAAAAGTVSITTASGTATLPFSVMAAPGNALAFDGADDYLSLGSTPAAANLGPVGFTLEAWVYFDGNTGVNSILRKTGDYNLYLNNGKLSAEVWPLGAGNPSWTVLNGAVLLPANRWTHVAATWNPTGTAFLLYVNGVPDAGATASTGSVGGSEPLNVGRSSLYNQYFRGRLDEVRVYSAALTQAQVQADMLSTTAAVPASLALYLNMDQGTPAGDNTAYPTLYDLAGGTAATLTGFDLSSGNTSSNYVASYALVVPTATAATSQTSTSFIATWAAPANGTVTSYLLDVATTADFSAPVVGSPFAAPASATSYGVTDLAPGTTYYYRVRALNSNLAQPDQGAYSLGVATTTAAPLPVTLVAFTATAEGRAAVRLSWATASEQNSARFEVQRSLDGVAFATIGTVAAAGTTATAHRYGLLDAALPTGASVVYYRLRPVDLDGTFSYSPVRTIALAGAAAGLSLFPNPAHGAATLTGVAPGQAVQVLDAVGRLVLSATADASGTATLALPAGQPGGVYVVRAGSQAVRLTVE